MGCCISHASGPNSPYPGGTGTSGSARAINDNHSQALGSPRSVRGSTGGAGAAAATTTTTATVTTGTGNRSGGGDGSRWSRLPLSQQINKPLRRHRWTSEDKTWTRAELDRERSEFFDTRVSGRQEMWQALRTALEVLWVADRPRWVRRARTDADTTAGEGEAGEADTVVGADPDLEGHSAASDDPATALATAQSILAAADITLPTGDLANGAYDAMGNFYPIPEHIVADPVNVSQAGTDSMVETKGELSAGDDDEETAEEDEGEGPDGGKDEDELERRREEKGKAVVDVRDQIMVRARLSEGARDVNISVRKGESVRSIARRVAEEAQLPPTKKVRIAYMGKILRESASLSVQDWKPGHVVNALVFNK